MNPPRRYSRILAPLSDLARSAFNKDAETGNGSGQKSLEAGGDGNPYVLPEIPTTPAFDHDTFSTTKQEPPIPAPSMEALEAHTAFTSLTSDNAITQAQALDNKTTQADALDKVTSENATAQAYAQESAITQAHPLDNETSENTSAQAYAPENVTAQAYTSDNATSETANAEAYAPENAVTQAPTLAHTLENATAPENATTPENATASENATAPENATTQAYTSEKAIAEAHTPENTTTPENATTPETTTAPENATAQAYTSENAIAEAHTPGNVTAQAHTPENATTQTHALNNTIAQAHTQDSTTTQAHAPDIAITQAHALDVATTQFPTLDNAIAQPHTPDNATAQSHTLDNAIAQSHTLNTTITQAQGPDSEDEFADDEAEIITELDEEALRKLPPALRDTMQAIQAENRKRLHRKTRVYPTGGLRGPESFYTAGEGESAATGPPTHIDDLPLAETMERFMREGESGEGPSGSGERVLRVTNPDEGSCSSAAAEVEDKGKGKAREPEDLEGTNTSSDETSMWMSVMNELAHEDPRAGVNRPNPLGSNPVTDEDRDMIAEIYRRNEAAREAARSRPVGAHRGNVGNPSDIVPMRQWKEEARRAGIPTSPDRPEEGTPVRSLALSTLLRPWEAITGGAAAAVAFVRGKLQGTGRVKGKGKGPERREDLVVGSSYKTRPSGRRDPAAPDQGPPPGLNMTTRGHVEDYTI